MKRNEFIFLLLIIGLIFVSSIFLYKIGIDAILNENPYKFYADSDTYHKIYAGDESLYQGDLIGVSSNYLGPLIVLSLIQGNYFLIMLINFSVYFLSVCAISRYINTKATNLGLILMLNPITLSSFLSVNKEVFIMPFLALAVYAHKRKSIAFIICALFMAVICRWQLALSYMIFLVMRLMPLRSRSTKIIVLLLLVSGVYFFSKLLLEPVLHFSKISLENYDGSGTKIFDKTLDIQNQGLYLIVFPLKALHLMYGMTSKILYMSNYNNFYNDVILVIHSLSLLIITVICGLKKRLTCGNDWVYAGLIFLVIFCLTPIFNTRYFYPVYILFCLAILDARLVGIEHQGDGIVKKR
jgi:hypothetical protein